MLKKIWESIRNVFTTSSTQTENDALMERYRKVYSLTRDATTLAQLLDARKQLRKFQQHLIEIERERWGRQLVIDLTKFWEVKYQYWKKKTRGL